MSQNSIIYSVWFLLFLISPTTATDVDDSNDPLWDNRYTSVQNRNLRIVSICFSCISLLAGTYAVLWYLNQRWQRHRKGHKPSYRTRVNKFRQKLVLALILFDLLKALMLTIYPAKKLAGVPDSPQFAAVIGWFTNVAIEGADMTAFLLAVQTAMLVFGSKRDNEHHHPSLKDRLYLSFRDGLYPYRKYIYVFCFAVFPLLLSSLAFVGTDYPANNLGFRGYVPLPTFVFLPAAPVWYRACLSWGPRYFIMFAIFCIYFCVFVHVRREFSRLDVSMAEMANMPANPSDCDKLSTWTRIRIGLSHFPGLGSLYPRRVKEALAAEEDELDFDEDMADEEHGLESRDGSPDSSLFDREQTPPGTPVEFRRHVMQPHTLVDLQSHINQQNLNRFRQRRVEIERQMNYIFIYPLAYLLLWTGPFVQQAMQYSKHKNEYSQFPIMIWAVVSQASNCFIDTVVFILRESNWRQWHRRKKAKRLARRAAARAQQEHKCMDEGSDSSPHGVTVTSTINNSQSSLRPVASPPPAVHPPAFSNYEMRFCRKASLAYSQGSATSGPNDPLSCEKAENCGISMPPPVARCHSSRRSSGVTVHETDSGNDVLPPLMSMSKGGNQRVSSAHSEERRSSSSSSGATLAFNPRFSFAQPSGRRSSSTADLDPRDHRSSISWSLGFNRRRSAASDENDELDLVDFLRQ